MVNPPSENNLPGRDPVTYASEVQDVLIPYTTKTDTYKYYEVRNYVNDVNQDHAQVLETYDDQMQARETYTYGRGRESYHNNQTGDTYNYLTSVSGSVTGLTKDGSSVASSRYQLYGSTKETSDTTGNPFAYNGEARDITELDYLRARYYDNQVGTFLTEDSYQGDDQDPLSQNLYSYVQNNPVNYTDPSGHKQMGLVGGGGRGPINTSQQRKYSQTMMDPSMFGRYNPSDSSGYYTAANYIRQRVQASPTYRAPASYYSAFGPNAAVYSPSTSYGYAQQYQSQTLVFNPLTALQQAQANGQSTYNWGSSKSKEGKNIHRNWTKALEETQKHVCDPKTMKAKDSKGTGTSAKQLADIMGRLNVSNYDVNLGGVASWKGTSSTINQPQSNTKKGHAFDPSSLKNLKPGEITILAGVAGLLVGLVGSPAAGFATFGAVSAGLASYVNGDKPVDVAINTAGGALAGYSLGKYVQGVYSALKGAVAGYVATNYPAQTSQSTKPYGPQPASGPLQPLKPYGPQPASGPLMPIGTLDQLTPRQIANMSFDDIQKALPKGWDLKNNNGHVHIYDGVSSKPTIRIDPPDSITNYPHLHFYDKNQQSLDINGRIVDFRSPDAHIPWNGGQ